MGRKIFLLACLLLAILSTAQSEQKNTDDESLQLAIRDIFQLAVDKNISEIDKRYVHSEFGIYHVFRIGVPDTFEQHSSIAFAFPVEDNHSVYPNLSEITTTHTIPKIRHYNAVFDCNEMVWDQEGLFITDTISYPKISEIIQQPVFETSEFPESLHTQSKYIEKNSCRVVLTELDIVFYLSLIKGRWYLTLFDRVTTDCSA